VLGKEGKWAKEYDRVSEDIRAKTAILAGIVICYVSKFLWISFLKFPIKIGHHETVQGPIYFGYLFNLNYA
jgi:hypothetical protein